MTVIDIERTIATAPDWVRDPWTAALEDEETLGLVIANTELWVAGLNNDQVTCRGYGHPWDIGSSRCVQCPHDTLGHVLTCGRCVSQKIEFYSQVTGNLFQRKYHWSPGYKRPKDAFPVPRMAFRAAAQSRIRLVKRFSKTELDESFESIVAHYTDPDRELTDRELQLADPLAVF